MPHVVQYQEQETYEQTGDGIVLEVVLGTLQAHVRCGAKVDTGAEYCVFAREHAENLGLDVESGHPIRLGTLTGSTVAFGHEVTLVVIGIQLTSICYFFENPEIRRSFLGRNGWLNKLRIGIDDTGRTGILYAGLPR